MRKLASIFCAMLLLAGWTGFAKAAEPEVRTLPMVVYGYDEAGEEMLFLQSGAALGENAEGEKFAVTSNATTQYVIDGEYLIMIDSELFYAKLVYEDENGLVLLHLPAEADVPATTISVKPMSALSVGADMSVVSIGGDSDELRLEDNPGKVVSIQRDFSRYILEMAKEASSDDYTGGAVFQEDGVLVGCIVDYVEVAGGLQVGDLTNILAEAEKQGVQFDRKGSAFSDTLRRNKDWLAFLGLLIVAAATVVFCLRKRKPDAASEHSEVGSK